MADAVAGATPVPAAVPPQTDERWHRVRLETPLPARIHHFTATCAGDSRDGIAVELIVKGDRTVALPVWLAPDAVAGRFLAYATFQATAPVLGWRVRSCGAGPFAVIAQACEPLPGWPGELPPLVLDAELAVAAFPASADKNPWLAPGRTAADTAASPGAPSWGRLGRLVASHHVESDGDGLTQTAPDGFIGIELSQRLAAGWYKITAEIDSRGHPLPRAWLAERPSPPAPPWSLMRRERDSRFQTIVRTRSETGWLFFRPSNAPTTLGLRMIGVEPMPLWQVARRAVATAWREARQRWPKRLRARRAADPNARQRQRRYRRWVATYEKAAQRCDGVAGEPCAKPLALVLIDAAGAPAEALAATLSSLGRTEAHGQAIAIRLPGRDQAGMARVLADAGVSHLASRASDPADWLNAAMAATRASWMVPLMAGDRLAPGALAALLHAARHRGSVLVFSDEDRIDRRGRRARPIMVGPLEIEALRSRGWLPGAVLLSVEAVRAAGGWRSGIAPAHWFDLLLRLAERHAAERCIHLPQILLHRAALPETAAARSPDAHVAALAAHLDRIGAPATAVALPAGRGLRTRYGLPAGISVSLLVATRDRPDLLGPFLSSLHATAGGLRPELVLVDNGTADPAARAMIDAEARRPDCIVLDRPGPFNFAALTNAAARAASGDVLVLLNNDLAFLSNGWLEELVAHAVRPEIGCVGAKLLYPDQSVQHAGLVMAGDWIARHAEIGIPARSSGYLGRQHHIHAVAAVTGAALAVRRSTFEAVGGLDGGRYPIGYNDVDLCLKVGALGLRNLWTPHAVIVHRESASRGRDRSARQQERVARERSYFLCQWAAMVRQDPYHSSHFDADSAHFLPRR